MNIPYFISGDWPFFFSDQIRDFSWFPRVYRIWTNFGQNVASRLWIDYPFRILVKVLFSFGLPWVIAEKLILTAILIVALWSMYQFSRHYFKNTWLRWVSVLVYVCNTYFFLVLGGGQLGVAAAIAFFPYAFFSWINLVENPSKRQMVIGGIAFSILAAFDLRLSYLLALAFGLYTLLNARQVFGAIRYFFGVFIITVSLHLYWILPVIMAGQIQVPEEATGVTSLSFFSVADFSHAMSLLHPNWPENLFGRVYFQQPEFLVLPLLAFASLLFWRQGTISNKKKDRLLIIAGCPFFAILALVGIFLAKGVNEPFGQLYQWFFSNIPGFYMFRDPTKFYVFIALSYAILIPMTLVQIVSRFPKLKLLQFREPSRLVLVLFILLELFLFRDVFGGKTTHSFQFRPMPSEYEVLKNILRSDTTFSRVLWIPGVSRFGYYDDVHPFIDAQRAFGISSSSAIIERLTYPDAERELSDKSIGYIVIPTDEGKNLFLSDYQFDPSLRQEMSDRLGASVFRRMDEFSDLVVLRNPGTVELFTDEKNNTVSWKHTGENAYTVFIPASTKTLTMHLAFDPGWRLMGGIKTHRPVKTQDGWMQFTLPDDVKDVRIYFAPDRFAKIGSYISAIVFVLILIILWVL